MSATHRKQAKARRARPRDDVGAFLKTGAMTPDEQLGLVLRFLREELDEANGLIWSSRLKGLTLRPLMSESGHLKIQWQMVGSYESITLPALKQLQGSLRAGIKALGTSGAARRGVWRLPRPVGLFMSPDPDQNSVFVWHYTHRDAAKGDDGSVSRIVLATARLFAEYADRVRACAWCEEIFVAVKRQEYCTPQHAQLARDQKKKTARNASGTKEGT
jgi:hypothetical protein